MWEHAGLVRDEAGLGYAASVIAAWRAQPRIPATEHDLENENLLLVAACLVAAARARTESVGAHFRSDAAAETPQGSAIDAAAADLTPATAPTLRSSGTAQRTRKEALAC
jgi:L-aspartate oxidase